jgi:hypothetical protein
MPAAALAAALGGAYLIAAPPAADLAAAAYRSDLLSRAGFTLWDNGWYGGHHLPGYSLLSPALGAVFGPRLLLVLATLAAVVAFARLAGEQFGRTAGRLAAAWFALGASVAMLSGRVPYTLGLALGLAALAALARGWLAAALALAVACSAASPVAGAFLALAALAGALAGGAGPSWAPRASSSLALSASAPRHAGPSPRACLVLAAGALAPVAVLAVAFPEGGYEPFAPSAFWPALAGVLAVALLLGPRRRTLRAGALLYALAMIGAFALHTPLGGNAARLGALFAGPLVAGALWRRRSLLLALAAPVLLYWQLVTPVRDLTLVAGDPSAHSSYYSPLLSELARLTGAAPVRVEVPLTGLHAEADQLAGHVLLARGWERQLDTRYGAVFYRRTLDAGAYRGWLADNAVSYVALPDVRLDHAGAAEGRLVAAGLPFLRELWRSRHWRLYAVAAAQPLVSPPAAMTSVGADRFDLTVPRPGAYTARVRFTPYWRLSRGRGCVSRAPGGWTSVRARGAGPIEVTIGFAVGRILDHGPRCR